MRYTKSLPFETLIPAYLFQRVGRLTDEVDAWCRQELRGKWVTSFGYSGYGEFYDAATHLMEFEFENDLIFFKLRWVG